MSEGDVNLRRMVDTLAAEQILWNGQKKLTPANKFLCGQPVWLAKTAPRYLIDLLM